MKRGGGHTTHAHQPLRNPQPSMRPHNTNTRDMPMLHPIRRLLLHLRQHIPNNLGILARQIPAPGLPARISAGVLCVSVPGAHNGDEGQLRPGEGVVEVVFQEVVLGEVGDIAGLDGGEEVDVRGVAA